MVSKNRACLVATTAITFGRCQHDEEIWYVSEDGFKLCETVSEQSARRIARALGRGREIQRDGQD